MASDWMKRFFAGLRIEYFDGNNGPYARLEVQLAEAWFGRAFDATHVDLLTTLGGTFGFELGFVEPDGHPEHGVSLFLGLGRDDHDLRDIADDCKGQLPSGWVPFAEDERRNLWVVSPAGDVYFVELDQELMRRNTCPEPSPPRGSWVAESFSAFVLSLRLPTWAREQRVMN